MSLRRDLKKSRMLSAAVEIESDIETGGTYSVSNHDLSLSTNTDTCVVMIGSSHIFQMSMSKCNLIIYVIFTVNRAFHGACFRRAAFSLATFCSAC